MGCRSAVSTKGRTPAVGRSSTCRGISTPYFYPIMTLIFNYCGTVISTLGDEMGVSAPWGVGLDPDRRTLVPYPVVSQH
ncbi:hypothetical protein GCM10014713_06740 [Streptomyces purpureus]|uniref:Uncharacterized protein n=1 Tax=Streptomyces purpureus TaxID=1951 RepID=A0A918GYP4_9ACTN|nr:hypothetical protein GCM10014713_06740 [Streptomyces purpureus]